MTPDTPDGGTSPDMPESDHTSQQTDGEFTDKQLGRLVILFWLAILTFPLSLIALFLYFLVRDMLGQ